MSEEKTDEAKKAPTPTGGLDLLRKPFPAHQIGKLPKETKKQKDARDANRALGIKCDICGAWHHKDAIHLDYVGHAALTDRLLDADPMWSWEPLSYKDGLPAFDATGGLWIKLTVCGVTRLGYGNAEESEYKDIGSRIKEVIGDALRNGAMRFGAALEHWHKGNLHVEDEEEGGKVVRALLEQGKPTAGARESLTQGTKDLVDRLAGGIVDAFVAKKQELAYNNYLDARDQLQGHPEAFNAVWDLLDSGQKSSLKRMHKEAQTHPATQA